MDDSESSYDLETSTDSDEPFPEPTPEHYRVFTPVLNDIKKIDVGFTYFIIPPSYYNIGIERVKIGFSNNLSSRFSTIQTSNPEEIVVYAVIESIHYKKIESFLHKSLSHRHYRGEWYHLSLDEIDTIVQDFYNTGPIRKSFSKYLNNITPDLLFQTQEERIASMENKLSLLNFL